ncbi:SMEK domain-containing protein [Ruegeria conchae]|uniref:SMEK domain-containing protein n=1 Tax=Ruegeria conchae TaxID=981384 RepID=UPI0029C7A175|nr:SMEK domain-containing protein [Ruegeria conchae]
MALAVRHEIQKIEIALARLVASVGLSNSIQLTDLNLHAEDFYKDLLNLVQRAQFSNLNLDQANTAAIDLGDKENRVAIQVTSTGDLSKTKKTVAKFNEYNLHEDYDRLVILNITKKTKHRDRYIGDPSKIRIDTKVDIWDSKDLLKQIKNEPLERLQEIRRFLEKHINVGESRQTANLSDALDPLLSRRLNDLITKRKFPEFYTQRAARNLVSTITVGEFQSCSSSVRCKALSWCARIISPEDANYSKKIATEAQKLGNCLELSIAEAFIAAEIVSLSCGIRKLSGFEVPEARSAALTLNAAKIGTKAALIWFHDTGFAPTDFDDEGLALLIRCSIESEDWTTVESALSAVTDKGLDEAPYLTTTVAFAHLCLAVEPELRLNLMKAAPFLSESFPLSAERKALENATKSKSLFGRSALALKELGLLEIALLLEDYELWLKLRTPEQKTSALQVLKQNMEDPTKQLRRVHWAIQYGLEVDQDKLEAVVKQETARKGGPTTETSSASMAIVMGSRDPEEVLTKLERLRGQIDHSFEPRFVNSIEIEMLARSGATDKARAKLDRCRDFLTNHEVASLEVLIDENEGENTLSDRIAAFERSNDLSELANLVRDIEAKEEWRLLEGFSRQLFDRTKSLRDFEQHLLSLANLGKHQTLVDTVDSYSDLTGQSQFAKKLNANALLELGKVNESRAALEALVDLQDDEETDRIRFQLAVTSGQWSELVSIVDKVWSKRESSSPSELLQAAQVGDQVGHPRSKDLTRLAAKSGSADANIFAAAYHIASSAGWENDDEVSDWLENAISMSDENGPIQSADIRDLLKQQPDWNRKTEAVVKSLENRELPMFGVARQLNRTLLDLSLSLFVANEAEQDARKKSLVYSVSGQRNASIVTPSEVIIEPTALLTLAWLDLFDTTLETFSKIEIPHNTLRWLFEERSKAKFHQPSRISDAEDLLKYLADGRFERFEETSHASSHLIEEVGRDLAALLNEANTGDSEKPYSDIVVRSYPIHKVGSLMDAEADLGTYRNSLVSCLGMLHHLRGSGKISSSLEQRAKNYLELREKPWPDEIGISEEATIYLDDVSVSFLRNAGVLEAVANLGQRIVVSKQEEREALAFIKLKHLNSKVVEVIESLQRSLSEAILNGKVVVLPNQTSKRNDQFSEHPSIQAFDSLASKSDVLSDDRFLNFANRIQYDGGEKSIFTSFDLTQSLYRNGSISKADYRTAIHKLRKSLAVFIPIDCEEICDVISEAKVINGSLVETEELRTIREYFQRVRLEDSLRRPEELFWLQNSLQSFCDAVKVQWALDVSDEEAQARSDWLLYNADIRPWIAASEDQVSEEFDGILLANILRFVVPPSDISEAKNAAYEDWLFSRLMEGLEETSPAAFAALSVRSRAVFDGLMEGISSESGN